MNRSVVVFTLGTAVAVVAGLGMFAHGGDLNPPAGPVAPTMTTLSEISAQISALGSAGGGGTPKRVVRGVIAFADGECEKTVTFSPAVNPVKSVVVLSPLVHMMTTSGGSDAQIARNGACLIDLTSTSIALATDAWAGVPRRVSYQIIEYP